jgi:hypothetical protein
MPLSVPVPDLAVAAAQYHAETGDGDFVHPEDFVHTPQSPLARMAQVVDVHSRDDRCAVHVRLVVGKGETAGESEVGASEESTHPGHHAGPAEDIGSHRGSKDAVAGEDEQRELVWFGRDRC